MLPSLLLLVVLPYGTALLCGAVVYRFGETLAGWFALGGLALGIYLLHKSMELMTAG